MTDKPIVYWARPIEIPGIRNNATNMITNNLVKTRLILDKILDNLNDGDKVAVKVHVGEAQNTRYLRPDYVREVVRAIKEKGGIPTLVETQGLGQHSQTIDFSGGYDICVSHRTCAEDHEKIANLHGYNELTTGATLKFVDGENGLDGKLIDINGIQLNKVSVASALYDFDKIVVISHFKGHPQATFGGALKQLGIGSVTKKNKHLAHYYGMININPQECHISKCEQQCISSCPVDAIKIEGERAVIDDLICFGCFACTSSKICPVEGAIVKPAMTNAKDVCERFIDNALGVVSSIGPEKFRFINFAFDLALMCDCVANPGTAVVPDLGILGSKDPVALDKACIDLEIKAPGLPIMSPNGRWKDPLPSGVEKFSKLNPLFKDASADYQFDAAVKNNIGSIEYKLKKI
ncbi:MAG: DUF362 domain-containing protein [Promethearchaeota archaeon]